MKNKNLTCNHKIGLCIGQCILEEAWVDENIYNKKLVIDPALARKLKKYSENHK